MNNTQDERRRMTGRRGVTLIETLIALLISSLLFLTIFRLTNITFTVAKDTIQFQKALSTELNQLSDYEHKRLKGEEPPFPFNVVSEANSFYGIKYQSKLGYIGEALP